MHLKSQNKMHQIWKSTVGGAQLLPHAFESSVLNVLHPIFCFCSTRTNKDLWVHHRSCKAHYKWENCEHFMSHKGTISAIQHRLLPLISNICGELGSCWDIRCTSTAERGRMPCQETHWYVSMGKWKLGVKFVPLDISFHFCVYIFPIETDEFITHRASLTS